VIAISLIGALAALVATRASQAPVAPVSLVPEFVVVRPGTAFHVAVHISLPDSWHIGWQNPGQSGLATTIDWRVSPRISAGQTAWPFPERAETIGTVSHIYRGEVIIVSAFELRADTGSGPLELVATVRWGICREICIPQEREVRISIPTGSGPPEPSPAWNALAGTIATQLPARPADIGLMVHRTRDGIRVSRAGGAGSLPPIAGALVFFPEAKSRRALAAVVTARATTTGMSIPIPGAPGATLHGVLVAEHSWGPGAPRALLIDLPGRP